jgi:hypothetical protein
MGVTKQECRTTTGKKRINAKGQLIDVRPDGKLAIGRFPGYKGEEHDNLIIELGRQGKGKAEMAAALGICRDTLNRWCHEYETFSAAMAMAWTECQAFWEARGLKAIETPPKFFNTRLYEFMMRSRFKDYREAAAPEAPALKGLPPDKGPDPENYTDEELLTLIRAERAKRRASRS